MAVDIKETITKAVESITKDEKKMAEFKKNPVKTIESVVGIDLPDDVMNKVVEGVKAKVSVDKAADVIGSIKKLF